MIYKVTTQTIKKLLLAVAIASILPASSVFAADVEQTITVTPAIFEQTIEPGSSKQYTVTVANPGTAPQSIKAYTRAFVPNEDVPREYLKTYDTARWFNIDRPDFILKSGEQRPIHFTITVPKNAEPGGHYATLYFEQLVAALPSTQKKVFIAPRIGVLTFLTVKGKIEEKLAVESFAAPKVSESGPIDLKLTLKNEGNVHILPTGSIRIFDDKGRQLDQLPIKPGMVLPHTEREFSVRWEKPSLVGKYTAKGEVTYGTPSQKLETREIEFWVIPWITSIIIVVVILLLILFFIKTRHHWRKAWNALTSPERRLRRFRKR